MRIVVRLLGTELLSLRTGEDPEPKKPDPPTDTTSHQGGSFTPGPQHKTLERGFIRWRP